MIFELDLDRTRYDKGLQDALTSAEEKGVSIDKAWKNLGTKSDEMFTRMKANAILSYETIAKSATASAEDQARAAAMGAAKIEALNAKQFATQIAQTKAMQAAQQQYWDNKSCLQAPAELAGHWPDCSGQNFSCRGHNTPHPAYALSNADAGRPRCG